MEAIGLLATLELKKGKPRKQTHKGLSAGF